MHSLLDEVGSCFEQEGGSARPAEHYAVPRERQGRESQKGAGDHPRTVADENGREGE